MIKYAGEGMAAGLDGVLCPSSNRGGWQQGFAVACVHRRELNVDVAFAVSPSRKGALATVVSPLSGYAITNHSTGCIWIGCGRDMRKAPDHALLWGRVHWVLRWVTGAGSSSTHSYRRRAVSRADTAGLVRS